MWIVAINGEDHIIAQDVLDDLRVVPAPDDNLVSFLRAKDLRTYLFIMRTRSFFTLLYVGGIYAKGRGGGQRPPTVLPPLRATGTVVCD